VIPEPTVEAGVTRQNQQTELSVLCLSVHVIDQAGTDTTPPIVRVDNDHPDQTARAIPVTDPNLSWRKEGVTDHSAFVNGDTRTIGGYCGIVGQQTIIEIGKRVADPGSDFKLRTQKSANGFAFLFGADTSNLGDHLGASYHPPTCVRSTTSSTSIRIAALSPSVRASLRSWVASKIPKPRNRFSSQSVFFSCVS